MGRIDRRDFVIASAALVGASLAHAQPAKSSVRRIGFLLPGTDPGPTGQHGSRMLRKFGWVEGENLIIERAFAAGNFDRMPALAEDLLRKGVEVLVTDGTEATLAAARATSVVPIVFGGVIWPVEQGLIESFARPARNATGMSYYTGVEVSNKRLQYIREIAPAARRLSWLWLGIYAEKVSGGFVDMAAVMGNAAKSLGFETRFHDIRKPGDVETALRDAAGWPSQALQVTGGLSPQDRKRIAEFVLQHRIPSATPALNMVEDGALVYYGPSPSEGPQLFERFFGMVDRILRGARPADMPVERPSKYDLVINMKTARLIGAKIPQSILVRADRVIE